ncbi:hypothetical protein FWP33_13115 [Vibrio parahaemolyticus]|uniref:Uncharacterized protein n=1 Tax=Vibrio jasicida TaxID=766224 RepID=A0AAU9QP33_9VIBR|nr:hypothetical protein [Vibrio parahaemolyticus]EJO2025556.1 hypothetical protein [Vibrio parahaemolyticus]CAH1592458.1 membrane hypothetical protein [Vibrio jasicida]CAH1597329.1 membrane hypothetical protein [Vibrio jasicida]
MNLGLRKPSLKGFIYSVGIAISVSAIYAVMYLFNLIDGFMLLCVSYATLSGSLLGSMGVVPGQSAKSTVLNLTISVIPPSVAVFVKFLYFN